MKARTSYMKAVLAVVLAAAAVALGVQKFVVADSPTAPLPNAVPVSPDSLRSEPIKGDAWVLDLLKERRWSEAEILVSREDPKETVRMVAWGDGEWIEIREGDSHLYEARVKRVQLSADEDGYVIFDRRFQQCPVPTQGRVFQTSDGPPVFEPAPGEIQFGRFAHLLWPWQEVRSVIEPRVKKIDVLRTFDHQGRETYEALFTFHADFEDENLVRWAEQNRDGWVYWIDAETGIVVREDFSPAENSSHLAEKIEIVGVNEQVRSRQLGDVIVPAGPVRYQAEVEIDGQGKPLPESDHDRIEVTASSDGTISLEELLNDVEPDGASPLNCALNDATNV